MLRDVSARRSGHDWHDTETRRRADVPFREYRMGKRSATPVLKSDQDCPMNFKHCVAFVLFGFCLTCASLLGQNPPPRSPNATNTLALTESKEYLEALTNGVAVVRLLSSSSTNALKEVRGYVGRTIAFTGYGSPLAYGKRLRFHSEALNRLRQELLSKGYASGGPVNNELRKTDDEVLMTDLLVDDPLKHGVILVKVDFVPFRRGRVIEGGNIWSATVFGTITGLDHDHKAIRVQVDPRNYQFGDGR